MPGWNKAIWWAQPLSYVTGQNVVREFERPMYSLSVLAPVGLRFRAVIRDGVCPVVRNNSVGLSDLLF
jgi:hypothetical protein